MIFKIYVNFIQGNNSVKRLIWE